MRSPLTEKQAEALRQLARNYGVARANLSWKGGSHPDDWDDIVRKFRDARKDLYQLIARLTKPVIKRRPKAAMPCEQTLHAVGGIEGIVECIKHDNTAPLELVIADARRTIAELEAKLKEKQG